MKSKEYPGQAEDICGQHRQGKQPDKPMMTYKPFFRERRQSCYSGDGKDAIRCC